MEGLILQIRNYMKLLKKEHNLDVVLCSLDRSLLFLRNHLFPYDTHRCPLCLYVKKDRRIHITCVENQKMVRNRLKDEEHFFGMCHVGICEHVFRIEHENLCLGFISVSSYSVKEQKSFARIAKTAKKFGLNETEMQALFRASVSETLPPEDLLKTLILPLADMVELLYVKFVKNQEEDPSEQNEIYSQIVEYISENYSRKITIHDICDALHYSRSYLSRIFSKYRKTTIMQYLNEIRINKAKSFLRETHFSISQIAFLVGFNDSNYFTNVFRQITKISPRQYRKKHQ